MKTLLTGILAAVVLSGFSPAQDSAAPPAPTAAPQGTPSPAVPSAPTSSQQASSSLRVAPGSVIPVELTKTIDAKKVKVGEEVMAKVTQDMKARDVVIVPKDTKVMGRVTEAQA